jgi:hypothetical protein
MIDFTFEYYVEPNAFHKELKSNGNRKMTYIIHAKTFEDAKKQINAIILKSNPRTMFDWFKLEENNYTGVKIYC